MDRKTSSKGLVDVDLLRNCVDEIAGSKEDTTSLNWDENDACIRFTDYLTTTNQTISDLKAECASLKTAFTETIFKLVVAAEFKDDSTSHHVERVGKFSSLMARKLGLPDRECTNIFFAAAMHDIGKIGISECVLYKPGKLSKPEYEIIKSHTEIGADILAGATSEVLKLAHNVAISHHERWDGLGYPNGLSGEDIPLVGRIVALADTFDALVSRRRYKDAYPVKVAVEVLRTEIGKHLDPTLVALFLDNLDEFIESVFKGKMPHTNQYDLSQRDREEEIGMEYF